MAGPKQSPVGAFPGSRTRGHRRHTPRGPGALRGAVQRHEPFPPILGSMAADSVHLDAQPGALSTGPHRRGTEQTEREKGRKPRPLAEAWSSRGKGTSCDGAWLPACRPHRHLSVATLPAAAAGAGLPGARGPGRRLPGQAPSRAPQGLVKVVYTGWSQLLLGLWAGGTGSPLSSGEA